MIPVGWLAPSADCWDANMLRLLLDGDLYPHGLKVKHYAGYPNTEGAVIVCPGQYWHRTTDQISKAIQRYEWVLLVRTADEEDLFDVGQIMHRNVRFWLQTPRHKYVGDDTIRFFGVGFPPHFNELPKQPPEKPHDVFLAAQNTHKRRAEAFDAVRRKSGSRIVHETPGFTQGLDAETYREFMLATKVAPAPSGAVSVDSFRFWEALEAHAVPIADTVSPVDGRTDYWRRIFDTTPFPIITDYKHLPEIVEGLVEGWPANANRVAAWWMHVKRHMVMALKSDLKALGAL